MQYIYNVIYYTYDSLYCKQELENELFDSIDNAKRFLNEIIEEESRLISDHDFYSWKIKIEKRMLNRESYEQENEELVFDMQGTLIYDSSKFVSVDKIFSGKLHIGDSIEILPFPWCIASPCEIKKIGIIAGYGNEEYLVYLLDQFKVIHLHIQESALKEIPIPKNNSIENKILSDIQKAILLNKNHVPSEESFLFQLALKPSDSISPDME
jgi:hypothetical protein